MGVASLGGIPFRLDPTSVSWPYKMKVSDTNSLGGKVVQILGVTMGDLIVQGTFGRGNHKRGDREGWEEQLRFRQQVVRWATAQTESRKPPVLRFLYPPRKWDFNVYVRDYTAPGGGEAVHMAIEEINPAWQLTLFVLQGGARKVIRGVEDLYMERLMEGMGWKQTSYNGPSLTEAEDILGGGTVGDYLAKKANDAFMGRLDQSQIPTADDPGGEGEGDEDDDDDDDDDNDDDEPGDGPSKRTGNPVRGSSRTGAMWGTDADISMAQPMADPDELRVPMQGFCFTARGIRIDQTEVDREEIISSGYRPGDR